MFDDVGGNQIVAKLTLWRPLVTIKTIAHLSLPENRPLTFR
jgi:hypothetical protein